MLNNNFFLLFVLAHLTGDYVLQTNRIAKMKAEGLKGVAIHTLIVGLVQITMLSSYGVKGVTAGAICTIVHFGIDCLKLKLGRRFRKMELPLYIMDQGLHFLTLFLLTLFLAPASGWVEKYIHIIRILIALILIVSMASVTAKTVARGLLTDIRKQVFFLKEERLTDTLWAELLGLLAVFLLNYAFPILDGFIVIPGLVLVAIGAYFYFKIQQKAYQYSWQASLLKYFTLVLFALLAVWVSGIYR